MKSVLIVVYSLSAQCNTEEGRIIALINMLRDYGWEPTILTHASSAASIAEPAWKVPEDIDIIRTGSISTSRLPGTVKSISCFLTGLLHGRQVLWEFLTVRKAARIVKNGGSDLVYTVSPPNTSHLVGLRLKKKFPYLPWVADFSPAKAPVRTYEKKTSGRIADSAEILIPEGTELPGLELSELFEKACRAVAAKKIELIGGQK